MEINGRRYKRESRHTYEGDLWQDMAELRRLS
jgi:hypothetical protein